MYHFVLAFFPFDGHSLFYFKPYSVQRKGFRDFGSYFEDMFSLEAESAFGAGLLDPAPVEPFPGNFSTSAGQTEYWDYPWTEVSVNQFYLAQVGTTPWEPFHRCGVN